MSASWPCKLDGRRYFKRQGYLGILDFIHLLSYVYALAMAVGKNPDEGWRMHVNWAERTLRFE